MFKLCFFGTDNKMFLFIGPCFSASKTKFNEYSTILRQVYCMGVKSSTQMGQIQRFFTRFLPIAFTLNGVGQNLFTFEKKIENPKILAWTLKMHF